MEQHCPWTMSHRIICLCDLNQKAVIWLAESSSGKPSVCKKPWFTAAAPVSVYWNIWGYHVLCLYMAFQCGSFFIWSKYHCYKQAPSQFDLRCRKKCQALIKSIRHIQVSLIYFRGFSKCPSNCLPAWHTCFRVGVWQCSPTVL